MKYALISAKLIIYALLFAAAIFLFGQIRSCKYFAPTSTATHIIDEHLAPDCKDSSVKSFKERFFDHAYVKKAAKTYSPGRYMSSYFILDFVFPFIYGGLFLALALYWKETNFYRIFKLAVIAAGVLDLGENISFGYYLFHQEGNMNVLVAGFTTLKSILFFLCLVTSLLAFVAACFGKFKMR